MKKEAIFAILIGIIVGLGITFGIYTIRKNKTSEIDQQIQNLASTPTPAPEDNGNSKLLITSPKDESILSSTSLRISGNAEPNEMIVIFINEKEYITQADSIGAFAKDVELDDGGNIIDVTSVATDGSQTTQTLNVVVSKASLDEKVEAATEDSTASAKPTPTTKPKATPKDTP
jgi:hypothetical protein